MALAAERLCRNILLLAVSLSAAHLGLHLAVEIATLVGRIHMLVTLPVFVGGDTEELTSAVAW